MLLHDERTRTDTADRKLLVPSTATRSIVTCATRAAGGPSCRNVASRSTAEAAPRREPAQSHPRRCAPSRHAELMRAVHRRFAKPDRLHVAAHDDTNRRGLSSICAIGHSASA